MLGFFVLLMIILLIIMLSVVIYCKKKLKIVLSAIIILITLYGVMLTIDMVRVYSLRKPIFVLETNKRSGVKANEVPFQGLGYKVNIEYLEDGNIASITMYMFNRVIACVTT
ncbi:hypothetical protein [[Clostridium] fimetarium]|uniref:Uncharacterized protein n=1 Tax=[Clostridium] fimetarium TaxID=99656 RepID=A0A1I0ME37_9FIRM|nr:hypothetical protein [[Clostridium] fimetarium]SEV86572.1 hypothetical protein SAMN05421659_101442 [[Clostridium] fimetarium]